MLRVVGRLPWLGCCGEHGGQASDKPQGRKPRGDQARRFGWFFDPERTLALAKQDGLFSLTTLREKLVKIGAKVVSHERYVTFQLAEIAVPRSLFQKILGLIDDLRQRPVPA